MQVSTHCDCNAYGGGLQTNSGPPLAFRSRCLSDVQEAAQLLGGPDLPCVIVKNLSDGTVMRDRSWTWSVLNLTPWEGQFGKVLLNYRFDGEFPSIRSLSVDADVGVVKFTERIIGVHLMKVVRSDSCFFERLSRIAPPTVTCSRLCE